MILNSMRLSAMAAIAVLAIASLGRCADSLVVELRWEYNTSPFPALSLEYDKLNRAYFYAAVKDSGLMIFETTNSQEPQRITTIPVSKFSSLHVMDVFQQENYLYLALGTFFLSNSEAGIAILDISDPQSASVTDVWQTTDGIGNGGSIVIAEGDYVYLGAMGQGLLILDVSDKNDIQFVSGYLPDINFPTANPSSELQGMINARGMAFRNDVIYLAYDYGGLRVIDVSDKLNLRETGRYINAAIEDTPVILQQYRLKRRAGLYRN